MAALEEPKAEIVQHDLRGSGGFPGHTPWDGNYGDA